MRTPRPSFQRLRDAAALLPAIGVFLFMPPAITLFTGGSEVAGVPLIVIYIFGVWLALIVCAALLAHRLGQAPPAVATPPATQAESPDSSA